MGCSSSRELFISEKNISKGENSLGFNFISCKKVDFVIRKHTIDGYITQSHLQEIAKKLKIPIKNTDDNDKIERFYEYLRHENGHYYAKSILLIGIFLSNGSRIDKAKLLYEVYDEKKQEGLDINFIKFNILKDIVFHAVISVSLLAKTEIFGINCVNRLKRYLNKLQSISAVFINKISFLLKITNSVSSDEFARNFAELYEGELTSFTGIRQLMLNLYNTEPPQETYDGLTLKVNIDEIFN